VVPNVLRLKLAAAEKKIRRRHCRVGRVARKYSRRALRGRVIKQTPAASRRERRNGFRIALVVGRGR